MNVFRIIDIESGKHVERKCLRTGQYGVAKVAREHAEQTCDAEPDEVEVYVQDADTGKHYRATVLVTVAVEYDVMELAEVPDHVVIDLIRKNQEN